MEENLFNRIGYDKNSFSSHGIEKNFEWFAYANYYAQSLFPNNTNYLKENEKEREITSAEHDFREKFYMAINSNEKFLNRCTKPLVEYGITKWVPGGYALACFVDALKIFFDFHNLVASLGNNATVKELYRNRDLIVPMIYADGDAMEWLEDAADTCMNKLKCKSVTGLFIYRIKPYNNIYPQKSDYPSFTQYDFGSTINIDSSKGLVSALADGLEENYKKNKYIGNMNFK